MALILPVLNGSSGVWGAILNDCLNGMDIRIVENMNAAAANTSAITGLTTRVNGHDTAITANSTAITNNSTSITNLTSAVNNHTTSITNLDNRLDVVEQAPPPAGGSGGFILCTSDDMPPVVVGQQILETDTGFMSYDSMVPGTSTPMRVPFPGQCILKVRSLTPQPLATGADEIIEWDQISNDRLGGHDGGGYYTVQVPGIYQVAASCSWEANTSGYRRLEVRLNDSPLNSTAATINAVNSGPTVLHTGAGLVKFVAGDTLHVRARHNSSASSLDTLSTVSEQPTFSCVYFGNCTY